MFSSCSSEGLPEGECFKQAEAAACNSNESTVELYTPWYVTYTILLTNTNSVNV